MRPLRALLLAIVIVAAHGGEAWRAAHPRPEPVADRPSAITLGMVTDEALAAMHPDGGSDLGELEGMLGRIREAVAADRVLPLDPGALDATAAVGDGWRLWVFWTLDVPEVRGLAEALVRAQGSGLADIAVVHLGSLRAFEEHLFRMNDYREAMVAAARAQDQARCDALAIAWRDELGPSGALTRAFHGGKLGLISRADQAIALRVESVPCFRLVSPAGRVHALDGFAPGADLVAWLQRCRAWEEAVERGEKP